MFKASSSQEPLEKRYSKIPRVQYVSFLLFTDKKYTYFYTWVLHSVTFRSDTVGWIPEGLLQQQREHILPCKFIVNIGLVIRFILRRLSWDCKKIASSFHQFYCMYLVIAPVWLISNHTVTLITIRVPRTVQKIYPASKKISREKIANKNHACKILLHFHTQIDSIKK